MIYSFIIAAIIVYPLWRIFTRAGFSPFWSFLVFIPGVGFPAIILMLALGDWPTAGQTPVPGGPDA